LSSSPLTKQLVFDDEFGARSHAIGEGAGEKASQGSCRLARTSFSDVDGVKKDSS
jgi:hypothetical protein